MRTDLIYEVHCVSNPELPLGRIGRIFPRPGGILLVTDGVAHFLEIEDPDEQLIDAEKDGHLEINTPKGRFILNAIDQEAAEELSPFYEGAPAEVASDEAAQAIYLKILGPL
jgi:hypothetical protein